MWFWWRTSFSRAGSLNTTAGMKWRLFQETSRTFKDSKESRACGRSWIKFWANFSSAIGKQNKTKHPIIFFYVLVINIAIFIEHWNNCNIWIKWKVVKTHQGKQSIALLSSTAKNSVSGSVSIKNYQHSYGDKISYTDTSLECWVLTSELRIFDCHLRW